MGRKKSKKKNKKTSAKKEKYAKFRKEKPVVMTFATPDLTPEQLKQRKEDDEKIGLFLRYTKKKHIPKGIGGKSEK